MLTGFVHVPQVPNSAWFWQFLAGKTFVRNMRNCGIQGSHCLIPPGDSSCLFYPEAVSLLPCSTSMSCAVLGRGNQAFSMLPLFLHVISPTTSCLSISKYEPFGQCSANPTRDLATNRKTKIVWNIIQTRWTKDHPEPSAFLLGHQSHTPPC